MVLVMLPSHIQNWAHNDDVDQKTDKYQLALHGVKIVRWISQIRRNAHTHFTTGKWIVFPFHALFDIHNKFGI